MLILSKKILKAYKHDDFVSAFVIGPQGIGKTTYAMLVAHEVYSDWNKVLDHLFFDPKEALPYFQEALETGTRIPLVIFDDAGYHLSKYLWSTSYEGQKLTLLYNALINLARTMVAGIIYTSPDMDVLKELRKKAWIVGEVQVTSESPLERQVKLYKKRIGVTGQIYVTKLGYDRYRLDAIPNHVRSKYLEKRRKAINPLLTELKERLNL
ncbi:MAG: hypothetical protein QXM76_01470 [Zestosphaera sp.]